MHNFKDSLEIRDYGGPIRPLTRFRPSGGTREYVLVSSTQKLVEHFMHRSAMDLRLEPPEPNTQTLICYFSNFQMFYLHAKLTELTPVIRNDNLFAIGN
jgi:hypothetical protein